jgi:hypothetical protein
VRRSWNIVAARLAQGFVAGVFVGALWALWTIRRRRGEPAGGT